MNIEQGITNDERKNHPDKSGRYCLASRLGVICSCSTNHLWLCGIRNELLHIRLSLTCYQ